MIPYAHLADVPAARHTLTQLRRAGLAIRPRMSQGEALHALANARGAAAVRQQEPPAPLDAAPMSLDAIGDLLRHLSTGAPCSTTTTPGRGTTPRSLSTPAGGPSGGRS